MMELLTDNILLMIFTVVISLVAAFLGIRGGARYQAWFKWANETAFFAWHNAETKGLLEGIKGADKFAHYMRIWEEAYKAQYGEEMDDKAVEFATKEAERLSKVDKELKAQVKALADPKV